MLMQLQKRKDKLLFLRLCFNSMLMALLRKSLKTFKKFTIHLHNKTKSSRPTKKNNQILPYSKNKMKKLSQLSLPKMKKRRPMKRPLLKRNQPKKRKTMMPHWKKSTSNKKKRIKKLRQKTIRMPRRRQLLKKAKTQKPRMKMHWQRN